MANRTKKFLFDIVHAVAELELFIQDLTPEQFSEFEHNLVLRRAIEREVEIMGEAIHNLVKNDSSYLHKIHRSRNIVDMRNQIVHSYDGVSNELIWSFVWKHVPILKRDVKSLLEVYVHIE